MKIQDLISKNLISGKFLPLLLSIIISSEVSAYEYTLLIKQCFSCDWKEYFEPFPSRERCEIARQGLLINGITQCSKLENKS